MNIIKSCLKIIKSPKGGGAIAFVLLLLSCFCESVNLFFLSNVLYGALVLVCSYDLFDFVAPIIIESPLGRFLLAILFLILNHFFQMYSFVFLSDVLNGALLFFCAYIIFYAIATAIRTCNK